MSASPRRNESLDVLRCIAVLLVVGYHLPYYGLWSRMGWMGVDLFFVLSGFLISGLLFQEYKDTGSFNVKRFLIRRGLKIYPSFYLLMMGATCLYFLKAAYVSRNQLLLSWLFLQNYDRENTYILLGHTWSLAVEEHFYLLLPALLMILLALRGKREPFRIIPILFVCIAAACLAFRVFASPPGALIFMTHMRADGLFAGVALGYLYHFRRGTFQKLTGHYALALAVLLCLPAALLDARSRAMQTIGLTGLLLGFSFLVAWSVVRTPTTSLGKTITKLVAKIGFYSYSIYLWHTAFLLAFISRRDHPALNFWLYVACAVVGGIAMSHLVELPYLAMREKFFPSSPSVPVPSVPSSEPATLPSVSARIA